MSVFKFSLLDFFLTCVGLVFLLLDIVLDTWAVVTFYQEKAYVCLCILLLFLLGSSVLVQAFSLLWYSYDNFKRNTKVEKSLSKCQLKLLHWLQLGIYLRHAGVVELSLLGFFTELQEPKDFAVYLSHDLSMLRLIETFSESAPQLVLMVTIMLQRSQLGPVTVFKAIMSAAAIACSVTMYHRSLRSFLPNKEKQQFVSSLVYFLWNLFLIVPRLTAIALFASAWPCFIFTHFFCSWVVLLFFVWRSKTDFMDSSCGEWLYRATVGLIWYFDWFNVVEGRTRYRTLLYHGYVLVDISFLCSLWCWKKMGAELPNFEISHIYPIITAVAVVIVYLFGLLFKIIYYKCYHPNVAKEELKGEPTETSQTGQGPMRMKAFSADDMEFCSVAFYSIGDISHDIVGAAMDVTDRGWPEPQAPEIRHCNKRMRKLAENFYS